MATRKPQALSLLAKCISQVLSEPGLKNASTLSIEMTPAHWRDVRRACRAATSALRKIKKQNSWAGTVARTALEQSEVRGE